MIYTLTLNPSVDHTLTVERFHVGGTFKASQSVVLPAGKGINTTRVIGTLGEPVVALGLVGEHELPAFAAALREVGAECRLVPVPAATRISVTLLDPASGSETHVREPGFVPPPDALDQIAADLKRIAPGDWVVMAGSLPPGVPVETWAQLIRVCVERGTRVLLDTNGPPLAAGLHAAPTLLRPNLFELWQVEGRGVAEPGQWSSDAVVDAARRVQKAGAEIVVVSLGERGVLGLDCDGTPWHAHVGLDRSPVDTVGCGDALDGGLVVALARGASFVEALRLGVACGAANALMAGAGCLRREDVDRLYERASAELVSVGMGG